MKARKKFNRGVIITVIAVLCVSAYLIGLDITQNAEKPAIQKVVESYINTYVSYNMLPQSYRIATPNIPQAEMDSYVAKMESDVKSYFAADDNSYKFMTDMLKSNLESQKTETTVIYSFDKTISKYTKFSFDKSTVTVTVETNSSYDGPDKNNSNSGRLKLNAVTTDTIVLKKVNGEWKVVYSNINIPSQKESFGGGMVIKRKIG
jgi:hypothetical protein